MSTEQVSKGLVVVVEDDPDFSEFLCTTLRDAGYETEAVLEGTGAIDVVRRRRPRAVTLDILMPGQTGIALYRELRKDVATRDVPVVVVTGVGTEGKKLDMARFFHGRSIPDPEAVLQKPVEPEELVETIERVVSERR